jgi:hemolysin activation/secretion protein
VSNLARTSYATAASAALVSTTALFQSLPASAADLAPGASTQRLQSQSLDAITAESALGNALTSGVREAARPDLAHLPQESPCFPIARVQLDGNPFDWLEREVEPIVGQCVGVKGIGVIHDRIGNDLIERGYITTRATVPPQSLASGTLQLTITPGRVGTTRTDGDAPGLLGAALPGGAGALLDQRDIDQALENIRRLPSQADARFDIAPGAQAGDSDIILHPGSGKRWRGMIGYDNAGQKPTGRNELTAALVVDSPLHLYDQLQVTGMTNANRGAPGLGFEQAAASWSVPVGYSMLTIDANRASYIQTYSTEYGTLQYTGEQKNIGVKLSGVVQRDAHSRTEVRGRFYRAMNDNQLNGTRILPQRRDVYGYELGVSHKRYIGNTQINASLGWRETLPGISRVPGNALADPAFSGREQLETASLNVLAPFRIGNQPFSYQFGWQMQNARTPTTAPDYFTIGTRYNVRGFDQQSTLAAESGWSVSNELDWYVPTRLGTQAVYAGIDAGRVRGATASYLTGDTLAGAVVGMRGSLAPKKGLSGGVNYDVSLGMPVYKPKGYPTHSLTALVQVSALF